LEKWKDAEQEEQPRVSKTLRNLTFGETFEMLLLESAKMSNSAVSM
jgi:hypothetical protein